MSRISVRRSITASLVATSVAMAAYGAHVAGASDPPPNVLKRWAATMGGDQSLSLEQALANARNFDMIAGHPRPFAPYLEQMRAINPDLKMIFYLNGAYVQKNEGTKYPESWYARDGTAAQDTAYEHVNVGQPLAPYAKVGAAYVRHFTNGVAVVNPTANPVTVDLGDTYRSLDGVTAAAVTLAPYTGDAYSR